MRKPYSEQRMWTVACALVRGRYDALVEEAQRRNISKSELVREYIEKGLNENERDNNKDR